MTSVTDLTPDVMAFFKKKTKSELVTKFTTGFCLSHSCSHFSGRLSCLYGKNIVDIVDQSVTLSPAPNPAGSGLRPTDLSQWPICADDAGCSDVHILYLCPWPVSVQCRSVSFTGVGLEICI